jgi:hypothetical protein
MVVNFVVSKYKGYERKRRKYETGWPEGRP